MKPALFLDRDGTLIEEVNYLARPDQVVLIEGAAEAIAELNRRGIPVIVITNQAGVARGYFPESAIQKVHDHLDQVLASSGASVDRYLHCPHHPEGKLAEYRQECDCRKPAPGLLLQAASELGIDLSRSCMVGDKLSDLEAGIAAGCQSILVRTGYGKELEPNLPANLALFAVVDALPEAIARFFADRGASPP